VAGPDVDFDPSSAARRSCWRHRRWTGRPPLQRRRDLRSPRWRWALRSRGPRVRPQVPSASRRRSCADTRLAGCRAPAVPRMRRSPTRQPRDTRPRDAADLGSGGVGHIQDYKPQGRCRDNRQRPGNRRPPRRKAAAVMTRNAWRARYRCVDDEQPAGIRKGISRRLCKKHKHPVGSNALHSGFRGDGRGPEPCQNARIRRAQDVQPTSTSRNIDAGRAGGHKQGGGREGAGDCWVRRS